MPRKKFRDPEPDGAEQQQHYPSTSNYDLSELYADLLHFAVVHLKLGGRLVCWIPIFKADYKEAITIPQHRCLELLANNEQNISSLTSRRLLTYQKLAELDANAASAETTKRAETRESVRDFRTRFFQSEEETRQERRQRKAELKEIGRQEALNRGKRLDENGKVSTIPPQ